MTIASDGYTNDIPIFPASAQTRAAVVRGKGGPFQIETLTVDQPRDDEVLVGIVATGMCHTDIVRRDQKYPVPLANRSRA